LSKTRFIEVTFEYGELVHQWREHDDGNNYYVPKGPPHLVFEDGDEITITGNDYRIMRWRETDAS